MEQPSDAVLLCGRDMAEGAILRFAGGTAGVFTTRRPGSDDANEDGALRLSVTALDEKDIPHAVFDVCITPDS